MGGKTTKIIVTDCDHDNMIQEEEVFGKAGVTYTHLACKTEDDLIKQARGGEITMTQYGPFSCRAMEASRPELKLILRYGVGVNTIDLEAATQLGAQVYNASDHGMNEVVGQAMGMMLGLVHKVCEMNDCTKYKTQNYMEAIPVHRIPGSTVGIVGFGRTDRTFVKRMMGFDCRRIVCDPVHEEESVHEGVEIVILDTLPKESDMIPVHCPLLSETMNTINMETFKKMKSTAYLVNTVRGGIINEGDLLTALQEKVIAGAVPDVVSEELMEVGAAPFELDNFLCSPHMAWHSQESAPELKRKIVEGAVRFAEGEPMMHPVNHLQQAAVYQTVMLQSAMQQAAVYRSVV